MKLETAVAAFSALSDGTRLSILLLLLRASPRGMRAGEIGEKLNVVSATLTFHLKKLIRGGFVRPPERHRLDYYTVNFTRISAVIAFFLNSSCARMPTDDFAQIRMALKRCRQRGTARPIGTRKT
jgi:DNA-binding transcriptional ArsR family regulator